MCLGEGTAPELFSEEKWGPAHGNSPGRFLGDLHKGHESWYAFWFSWDNTLIFFCLLNLIGLFLPGTMTTNSWWPNLKTVSWGHEPTDSPNTLISVPQSSQIMRDHTVLVLMELHSLGCCVLASCWDIKLPWDGHCWIYTYQQGFSFPSCIKLILPL